MHFDNEIFLPAQKQLRLRNNQINTVADDGKYSTARALLGKNLHTMQKFYSHSNWIELGNLETIDLISDTLGQFCYFVTNGFGTFQLSYWLHISCLYNVHTERINFMKQGLS